MRYGAILLFILFVGCVQVEKTQCWDGSFAKNQSLCPPISPREEVATLPRIEKSQELPSDNPRLKGAMDILASSKELLGVPEIHPNNIFFSSDIKGHLTKRYRVGLENRVWLDIAEFNESLNDNESELLSRIKDVYWDIQQKYPNLKIRNAFRDPALYALIASQEHNIADVESINQDGYEYTNFTIELFEIYPGKDEHGDPLPNFLISDRYYNHQRVFFCPPNLLLSLDRGIDSYYQTADFVMTPSVDYLVSGERNMANSKVKADRGLTEKLMSRLKLACNAAIPRVGYIDYSLRPDTIVKRYEKFETSSLKTVYYNKTRKNEGLTQDIITDNVVLQEKTQNLRVNALNKTTLLLFNGTSPCTLNTRVIINKGGFNGTTGFVLKSKRSNKHLIATYESTGVIRNTPFGYQEEATFVQMGLGKLGTNFTQRITFEGDHMVIRINEAKMFDGEYRMVRDWYPLEVGLVVKNADITFEDLSYKCYG